MSGSSISWAICKSAPRSRLITVPAPHHSVFTGWMPFLPANQQRQITSFQKVTVLAFKNKLEEKKRTNQRCTRCGIRAYELAEKLTVSQCFRYDIPVEQKFVIHDIDKYVNSNTAAGLGLLNINILSEDELLDLHKLAECYTCNKSEL